MNENDLLASGILGGEGAGIVEAIGEKVKAFRTGDKVVYLAPRTFAEYSVVSENRACLLPQDISFETGCGALLQGLKALAMCRFSYPIRKGDFVLIHAAGSDTGSFLVQMCKLFGANVIATVSHPPKAEFVKALGADHVIVYSTQSVVEAVNKITSNRGVHAVFDGVGKATVGVSLKCLTKRGYFISYGDSSGEAPPISFSQIPKSIYITRPVLADALINRDRFVKLCEELFDLLRKKAIRVRFRVFEMENAQQALDDLKARRAIGKLLLKVQ
ncbi:hypothetical protein BKA69DRAFT_427551 [Paraphysoderma sedebokerense]|nr:hypothetical protein BKA69DRAFT_427551 [Paraphysoderma sedebokerense]